MLFFDPFLNRTHGEVKLLFAAPDESGVDSRQPGLVRRQRGRQTSGPAVPLRGKGEGAAPGDDQVLRTFDDCLTMNSVSRITRSIGRIVGDSMLRIRISAAIIPISC